jgi:energy-converting hydrogenase B subunit D
MVETTWLDAVLAAALVGVGWRAVAGRGLFVSVVLYIVFGLLLALAWVRLDAPDIALAEAAIGAGLTGALLLDAVAEMRARRAPPGGVPVPPDVDADDG